ANWARLFCSLCSTNLGNVGAVMRREEAWKVECPAYCGCQRACKARSHMHVVAVHDVAVEFGMAGVVGANFAVQIDQVRVGEWPDRSTQPTPSIIELCRVASARALGLRRQSAIQPASWR